MMRLFLKCLWSPRLYRIYGQGPREGIYKPHRSETIANQIISGALTLINVGFYTSPFIFMYIYKRGFLSMDEVKILLYSLSGIALFMACTYMLRTYGRASNDIYLDFINNLIRPTTDQSAHIESVRKYDFDFYAWPSSYKMKKVRRSSWLEHKPFSKCANPDLPKYQRITVQILAYIAVQTFALRLIYPGTLSLIQNMLWLPLCEGRTTIVERYNGKRAKIITSDGNAIDTMFVDNRRYSSKGRYLVVCCEGNSGFYEVGIMSNPIKTNYSAIGWNHPGFGGSTGTPFPRQEQNAIDAVIQYAINELGFDLAEIILFGWSIGGYAATWAAVNYPNIKGLILDASFDDLMPLAKNQMPKSWKLLVKEVVRSYVNLNIAEMLNKYDGPIRLIRRTEDEIICLRSGQLATNRGNYLLIRLLELRHPELFEMDTERPVMETLEDCVALSDQQRIVLARTKLSTIKNTILPLISRYMRDFRSSHCMPLPDDLFVAIMLDILID